ncbi:MAG: NAD(P)-dependent oxidoreductase [Dehalococcoidales bacterium]|nr:NAD(P)-dependent oxidoreductase [Dehalococcoidales bacterium]
MNPVKAGFIGLGNMGILMARTLAKSEIPLTVYDLRQEAVNEMMALGASSARSCLETAAGSDVIISIVRDEHQNDEVIFGPEGVWVGIKEGSVLVISSTVSPEYCRKLYVLGKEKGIQVVDAPVSAESRDFTPGRESAVFTLMIGGDQTAVEKCMPVFRALTKNVFHLGGVGSGQIGKLVNNLAAFGNAVYARECINIGLKAGLDYNQLTAAMRVATGFSRGMGILDMQLRRPYPASQIPERNDRTKSLDDKDRDLALELAAAVGAQTPISQLIGLLDLETVYDGVRRISSE